MNMQEALEWAADYAKRNGLFEPVTNSRGYADGWKPPTPEEKRSVITALAKDAAESPSYQKAKDEWRLLVTYLDEMAEVYDEVRHVTPRSVDIKFDTTWANLRGVAERNLNG